MRSKKAAVARRVPSITPGAHPPGRAYQVSGVLAAAGAEPIAAPQAVQPAAAPVYHGGSLLQNVEACAVFIGAAWSQPPASQVAQTMQNFVSFFVTSELISKLAVFNDGGFAIGHGTAHPPCFLPGTPVGDSIQDAQIRDFLTNGIAAGDVPAKTPNSLYILFMPDGVVISHPQLGDSCGQFCGYHSSVAGTPYIVMPFLSCDFCLPADTSTADAMTAVLAHELCEAITNPFGDAWFADDGDQSEVGDLCNSNGWSTRRAGGFLVQQFCLRDGVCF